MSMPAAGPSKYAVSSVAAQLGSAIVPVSSDQPRSLAVVIPMRWKLALPAQVDLSVIATHATDAPAIRSHAPARSGAPGTAPAASRSGPGPWKVWVREPATALRDPVCAWAVVDVSVAPANPNQPDASTSNPGFAISSGPRSGRR